MTLTSPTARNDYALNGATTIYPYTFRVFAAVDLQVLRRSAATGAETLLAYPADFAVSGVGNTSGGSVTLVSAGTNGDTLAIRRNTALTQATDLANQGRYAPADIEAALDRLTGIDQQQQDQLDRSLRLAASVNPTGKSLILAPLAGQVVTGDAAGGLTMATIATAAAVALPGAGRTVTTLSAYLANNAVSGVLDFAPIGVVINTGANDARSAFVATDAIGNQVVPPGLYRIASNLTLSNAILFQPGAVLKPDAGVTITFNGPLVAGLWQIFDMTNTPASATQIQMARGVVPGINPEWWGAVDNGSGATTTPAVQAAVLTSLGMANLTAQSTVLRAPVLLNALYTVTTVYLPRSHELRGVSSRCGVQSIYNLPILVLGRSLAEASWLDSTLVNVAIAGTVGNIAQHGVQAALTGASAYIANLDWRGVAISNVGAEGVRIISDNIAGMIVRMDWDKVKVVNSQSYCVHIKVGVFNVIHCNDGLFSDCGNGFYVEDIGSGTTASETVLFTSTQFEALGTPLSTGVAGAGTFGFRSTMYTGHYTFDNCYFEGCGNKAGDTTGHSIYVRAPWMLSVRNSLLFASNNHFWMAFGGNARVEGCSIDAGANNTSIVTLDSPPPGSDYSYFEFGLNKWGAAYPQSQLVRVLNGATTVLLGYQGPTRNYAAIPPRQKLQILRDGATTAADDGAIGYNAVKRLANNSGGSTTIVTTGIANICKNTVSALVIITEYNGSLMGLFLLASGAAAPVLISQKGTKFTIAKDSLTSLNVYNDTVNGFYVVQNTLGSSALLAVRFLGCEPMENADNGFYDGAFA